MSASGDALGDDRDDRSRPRAASSSSGSSWDLVVATPSSGGVRPRRRAADGRSDEPARASCPGARRPELDVAYRLGDGRYVDAAGRPLELPDGPERAITLVTVRGEEVAALVHDPALLDEPALVESVRATAGLVLENERLAAEVRAQLAEVRASRARIVAAADAERRRIERNLHDGAQQRLVTLSLGARARGIAPRRGRPGRARRAHRTRSRRRSPSCASSPAESTRRCCARRGSRRPSRRSRDGRRLPVTVEGSVGDRLPDAGRARRLLPRLGGAHERRQARRRPPRPRCASSATGGTLRVAVADDGSAARAPAADSGLAGLRDRLEALDATLVVESEPGARHDHQRGDPMRVVIADDAALDPRGRRRGC